MKYYFEGEGSVKIFTHGRVLSFGENNSVITLY